MLYPLGTFPEEGTLEIGVLTDECGVVFFFLLFFFPPNGWDCLLIARV